MKNLSDTVRRLAFAGLLSVCLSSVTPRAGAQYMPPANNRVNLNFNYDWKFIKQDVPNAQTVGFDDSAWTAVSLPHTWNDGDRYREWISTVAKLANQTDYPNASYGQAPPADPLLPDGTYYGIGWYRKHFTIDPAYAGRKVILEFSGISRCAHFYVNGVDIAQQVITLPGSSSTPAEQVEVGYHENGIGPCGLDITNYLNPAGQDNLIAVWVTNDFNYVTEEFGTVLPYGQPFNLNFGGLQRDATMHISDPLYQTLPLFRNRGTQGTYVYASDIDTLKQTANLTVQAEVKNDYAADKTATLDAVIVDASGNQVGSTFSAPAAQTVTAGSLGVFTATTSMTGVHFWDTDYPYMYQVYTILKVGGQVVDVYKTPLGGYNTGVRYTTNVSHLTSGYPLNIEAGINRVFVRAPRTAGTFTLHVTGSGLTAGDVSLSSQPFTVTNGLTATLPQTFTVALGTEPTPVSEGIAPPPPPNSLQTAPASNVQGLHYSGTNQDQAVLIENVQPGQLAYVDSSTVTLPASLPGYLVGGEFIQPFQSDANGADATDQYQFNTSRYSHLYLVIDAANGMPANDGNAGYQWTRLADTVTVNGRPMNVYKSILQAPYTPVFLASNNHDNATPPGFNSRSNMYLVFIVSAEQQLQNPADAITASTTQNTGTPAADALDGNVATRWNAASGAMPQVLTLTLNNLSSIGGYEINWQNGATHSYQYEVDVSADGNTWLKSLDQTANVTAGTYEYRVPAPLVQNSTGVKYVRLTVTAASGGAWAAVNEWTVNGVLATAATPAVPVITSPLTASGKGGYAFSYQIAATNTPTGYAAQGLPAGLTLNGITGLISGVTLQSGVIPITVSAINPGGTGSAVLNLTLAAPPSVPVITSALNYSTQAGVAIATASAYTITATNMTYMPASFSATLPASLGLTYSASTGKITGTPKYPGTYAIPIDGTNAGGAGPVANLQFVVTANGAPPALTSPATAADTVGTVFTYQIAGTNGPKLFGAGPLPPGLSVGPNHLIVILAGNLALGIYSANPGYTVDGTSANIGNNDVYSAVVRDVLTGYALGFVNSATLDPNTGSDFKDETSDHWWSSPQAFGFLQGNPAYYDQYAGCKATRRTTINTPGDICRRSPTPTATLFPTVGRRSRPASIQVPWARWRSTCCRMPARR